EFRRYGCSGAVVDNGDGTKATGTVAGIGHKVSGPHQVGRGGYIQRLTFSRWHSALGTTLLVELERTIHAIYPLMIPLMAPAPDQCIAFPEAPTWTLLDQLIKQADDLSVPYLWCDRFTIVGRQCQPNAAAAAGDRQAVRVHQVTDCLSLLGRP